MLTLMKKKTQSKKFSSKQLRYLWAICVWYNRQKCVSVRRTIKINLYQFKVKFRSSFDTNDNNKNIYWKMSLNQMKCLLPGDGRRLLLLSKNLFEQMLYRKFLWAILPKLYPSWFFDISVIWSIHFRKFHQANGSVCNTHCVCSLVCSVFERVAGWAKRKTVCPLVSHWLLMPFFFVSLAAFSLSEINFTFSIN